MENRRSFDHTMQSGTFGSASTCSKRGSPIASPRFQGRKPDTRGKVPRLGELQLGVGYCSMSRYCSAAPAVHTVLSTIAEEAVPISLTFSAPANPVPSPVPPVLSLQQRMHIHSIGGGSSTPPLSIVSENMMCSPVWQVSHLQHDDPFDFKIVVPDFCLNFNISGRGNQSQTFSPNNPCPSTRRASRQTHMPRHRSYLHGFHTVTCFLFLF